MLLGTLAAAVTPLCDNGDLLDSSAFASLTQFYQREGVDGILAMGTTGEGIMLSQAERRTAAELFMANAEPGFQVAVHCGAQTTRETVALARHARDIGAAAVAVIGPPYYIYDEAGLFAHFAAAARACDPLPFYAYEFHARVGYSLPIPMLQKMKAELSNFVGIKISNSTWESFKPYQIPGLDVFTGPESLIFKSAQHGARGAVSGLAAGFPSLVASQVRNPDEAGSARLAALRTAISVVPFQSALKYILQKRGVQIKTDVRAPLRRLEPGEEQQITGILQQWNLL